MDRRIVKFVKNDGEEYTYSQCSFKFNRQKEKLFEKEKPGYVGNLIIDDSVLSVTFINCIFENDFKIICKNENTNINFINCIFENDYPSKITCYLENGNINFNQVDLKNPLVIDIEKINEFNLENCEGSISNYLNIKVNNSKRVNINNISGNCNLNIIAEEVKLSDINLIHENHLIIDTSLLKMHNCDINNLHDIHLKYDLIDIQKTKIKALFSKIYLPNATYKEVLTDRMINDQLQQLRLSLLSILKGYKEEIAEINSEKNTQTDKIYVKK